MQTTSGCSRAQTASASAPSAGLAHDVDVVLPVEDRAESAADQRLVVDQDDADHPRTPARTERQLGVHPPARPCRPRLEPAAEQRHALAHARPAPAPPTSQLRPRRAGPPSATSRTTDSAPTVHLDAHPLGGGVLEHVGQRLLHQPVGGDVEHRRQVGRQPLGLQPHRQPGPLEPVDQLVQPVQPGLRSGVSAPASSSARSRSSSRRRSSTALRPVASTESSRSRTSSSSAPSANRAAPACTTITETAWATTSCSSRAMRARSSSSSARSRAACSRDCAARASASSSRWRSIRRTSRPARVGGAEQHRPEGVVAGVERRDVQRVDEQAARPGRRARRAAPGRSAARRSRRGTPAAAGPPKKNRVCATNSDGTTTAPNAMTSAVPRGPAAQRDGQRDGQQQRDVPQRRAEGVAVVPVQLQLDQREHREAQGERDVDQQRRPRQALGLVHGRT